MKRNLIQQYALLLLMGYLLTSCYTTQYVSVQEDYNKAYVGATRASIKSTFGIPDRVVHDKDLGEILIYEKYYTETTGVRTTRANAYDAGYLGVGARATTADNSTTTTEREFVEFYFKDTSDRCYKVKTNRTKGVQVKDLETMKGVGWGLGIGIPLCVILTLIICLL